MAASPDGAFLYPMLEGALGADPEQRRRPLFEFDVASGRYTGARWEYRTESPENSIGDLVALGANRFLVIERNDEQGEAARFKKIFLMDLRRVGEDGFLSKEEIVDLLSIDDPARMSEPTREGDIGLGERFSFPFQAVESLLPLGDGSLLVINDNNYPLSAGRNPARPDDTEAIIVRPFALPASGGPPLLAPVAPLAGAFVPPAPHRARRSP
jgi:glycerophosphoryl diester phosphodiesterase